MKLLCWAHVRGLVSFVSFWKPAFIVMLIWCDLVFQLNIASRSHRREWALLSFQDVCLDVCRSFHDLQLYHDWSIRTKFGRQVYTCPRPRVSLFGPPVSHTLGARGKNMQNFAYFQHASRSQGCHLDIRAQIEKADMSRCVCPWRVLCPNISKFDHEL